MMRLRSLTLDLFGHFSAKSYDFGDAAPDRPDFHVIYGPNEAGKTTSMEGFLRLLYGFPHIDPYGFLHQRKNLKVSGVLDVNGQRLELTRLSTRDGSLRDANDMILPEAAIQAHLGSLSETDYRQLLCLDDETIEKGGDEIVASNGDIGRLLFSAAAGVSDLTGVLDQFRSKADSLYRKRASSTEAARLKKELADVDQQIKDLDVPASAYKKLKQALETARQEEADLRSQRKGLHDQKAILSSEKSALPLLSEIQSLTDALADHEDFPRQLEVNPEDLVELLTRQNRLLGDKDRLEAEIATLTEEQAGLVRNPSHQTLQSELAALASLSARYSTAQLDLEKRRKALAETHADMARSARDLQVPEGTDPVTLVVTEAQLQKLEDTRQTLRDLSLQLEREGEQLKEAELRLRHAQERQAELKTADTANAPVGPLLQRYAIDSLAPRFASATEALKSAAAARDETLADLAMAGQTFDAVPASGLSLTEAEELAHAHDGAESQRQTCAERCSESQRDLAALALKIEHLTSASGLIDDDHAKSARAERDRLWSAHKSDLSLTTANAFEAAMESLDKTSSLRLDHAAELGQLRGEEQRRIELQARYSANKERLARLEEEATALLATADGHSRAFGFKSPVPPKLLAQWVAKRDLASKAQRTWERLSEEHEETLASANRLAADLRPLLNIETGDFQTLVSEARRRLQDERNREDEQKSAEDALKSQTTTVERHQQQIDELKATKLAANSSWQALAADCFQAPIDTDLLVQSLQPLRSLRELELTRSGLIRQIESMEADQADFSREVSDLAQKAGLPLSETPAATYGQLHELAKAAQKTEDTYVELGRRLETARSGLAAAETALREIEGKRLVLAETFPERVATGSLQSLRSAVSLAGEVIGKRKRLESLTSSLQSLIGSFEDAKLRLEDKTDTDLTAALSLIDEDLNRADQQLEQAIERRSNAQRDLAAVSGDGEVARLVERKTTLELALEETVLTYLETQYGLSLAEEAIRRYRDTHRSSMMEATEKAFADLTNGAYARLTTQPEGKTEALLAIDARGTAKKAMELSKGTRFQLYLALRAAAYQQLASQNLCLPFFCDDIFETFDESRTRSACKVMSTIGRTGQAIYLTHHQHVVDIAREVCGSEVTIHRI